MRAGFVLGNWNSDVISFLNEYATVAGLGEPPDIVWAGGEWFEFRSIGAETGEFRLNEGNFFCAVGKGFSSGASDLGAVKESLSEGKGGSLEFRIRLGRRRSHRLCRLYFYRSSSGRRGHIARRRHLYRVQGRAG